MKTANYFLLLFLLIFGSQYITAQNYQSGYIITNQNDTIHGLINFRTDKINQEQCAFKTDESSASKIYLPEDIAGYRLDDSGKYYVSRTIRLKGINSKNVFLEFLVDGLMNLYYYFDNQDYYFFENQDGKMNAINQVRWTENIKEYVFQEYAPIVDKTPNLQFNQKSMIKIVKEYHHEVCTTGEECIVFQNPHPDAVGFKLKFSVYTGLQQSAYLCFTYDKSIETYETASGLSPVIGGQINLSNPRWSQSLSVQLDASVSQFKGTGTSRFKPYHEEDYSALAASARLGLKYTYPKNTIRPTAEVGMAYTQLLHQNKELRELKRVNYGYYLALGADYRLKNAQALFLRLVYEDYPLTDRGQSAGNDNIRMPQIKVGYTL